jgi:hypothetical protein
MSEIDAGIVEKVVDIIREGINNEISIPELAHAAIAAYKSFYVLAERDECAKAAERLESDFLSLHYETEQPLSSFRERFACRQVAAAIRARATQKVERHERD